MSNTVRQSLGKPARLSQRSRWTGTESGINDLMARTLAQPDLISLAAGFVDQKTLPVEPSRAALDRIWADPKLARAALQYGTTIGYPPLRETIRQRLVGSDGPGAACGSLSIDRVVITAGSNQLLYLVTDILCDPGDVVLCASPSYFVYLGTLANLGVQAVGVEIDENGAIPETIEDQLARLEAAGESDRVKAIYLTSYYDNPTGLSVSAERRAAIVQIARRWSRRSRIHVIEDAAYRELRYYGEDIPSLWASDPDGETVVHVGTFSKSFSPGIRTGWGILPDHLVGPVLAAKGNLDFGSPNFNQILMATVLQMDLFEPHLARLRRAYRAKLEALLGAADEHLASIPGVEYNRPTGGLYVWLRLPESIDTGPSGPLFDRAVAEGVLYVPGAYCYPSAGASPSDSTIRLSFGVQSCESIRRGVAMLGRAIRGVL